MLTWKEIHDAIAEMSKEDQGKPAMFQNMDTGEFTGFDSMDTADDEEANGDPGPVDGWPILNLSDEDPSPPKKRQYNPED